MILRTQRHEVEVVLLVSHVGALGHCDDAPIDVPREDNLGRGDVVFGRECEDDWVVSDYGVACWCVGCHLDAFAVAVFLEVFLDEVGVASTVNNQESI